MRYLFFGFGDQQYLLHKNHSAALLLAALWPGRAMLLVTGLSALPQDAFGASQIAELSVTHQQVSDLQSFVAHSLVQPKANEPVATAWPYQGSLYFSGVARYSAFHTCNTWVAEALQAGSLPIHSAGVVFAGQLWKQVRRVERELTNARSEQPFAVSRKAASSHPDK